MKPLVSIIVPIYNSEKHLSKCIETLINQEYSKIEILLINDGSTDNSKDICNYYSIKDQRIKVFNLENGGVSKARNYGIKVSKGDYIQFVDSDDFVEKEYTMNMIKNLNSKKIDLVISGINQVSLKDNKYLFLNSITSREEGVFCKKTLNKIINEMIEKSYINYCYSKLIKKNILIEHNLMFKEDISLGEDTIFILDLIKLSDKICITSEANYNYVIHSNDTLTYKFRENKFDLLININNKIRKFCIEENLYNLNIKKILDIRYMEILKFCLDENFKVINKLNGLKICLNNINNILLRSDVIDFINNDLEIINNYNKGLIKAIRSKKAINYFFIYYILIITNKFRRKK